MDSTDPNVQNAAPAAPAPMPVKGKSHRLLIVGIAVVVIVIIAGVVLVLGFPLGLYNNATGLPNACIAESGYSCSMATGAYSHSTGNIAVTLGQSTGENWVSAQIIFANITTLSEIQSGSWPSVPPSTVVTSMENGATQSVSLAASSPNVPIGTAIAGQIWARYQVSTNGPYYMAEMAVVTVKAQ